MANNGREDLCGGQGFGNQQLYNGIVRLIDNIIRPIKHSSIHETIINGYWLMAQGSWFSIQSFKVSNIMIFWGYADLDETQIFLTICS